MKQPDVARMLFPAVRWSADGGFEKEWPRIERALDLGVGGFVLFGGAAPMVQALTTEMQARAQRPLLIGSDLERGAGQQFTGATSLPPLAALGAMDEPEFTRRAAKITAREAVALGVNWVYAPVADVDLEPANPIVGTRAFGSDVRLVQRHVRAWIEGCRGAGALACAKHFPGHGRTTADSHETLPHVAASRAELETDLAPFRTAIEAGVDSIMTAHVAYPALDQAGRAATLSPPILNALLRDALGFDGVIVSDALIMQGVLEGGGGEGRAAVRAAAAGCDALLYPDDIDGVVGALEDAVGKELDEARVRAATERLDALLRRAGPAGGAWGRDIDHAWAGDLALRSLIMVRGTLRTERAIDVLTIDDDVGGPFDPPSRAPFTHALRGAGLDVEEVDEPRGRPLVVALYADIRAWKGSPGVSTSAWRQLEAALGVQPEALVLLFGHPRLAEQLPGNRVLAAWGGEAVMQRAAALRLAAA